MVDRQLALSEAARPWIERVSVETYASDVDAYPFIYAPDPATTLGPRVAADRGRLRRPASRRAPHPGRLPIDLSAG